VAPFQLISFVILHPLRSRTTLAAPFREVANTCTADRGDASARHMQTWSEDFRCGLVARVSERPCIANRAEYFQCWARSLVLWIRVTGCFHCEATDPVVQPPPNSHCRRPACRGAAACASAT